MNYLTLEQTFFSQVLPKTVKLFDDMMYELSSQARELSSQNLEIQTTLRNILQTMVQVLGALTGCVQHVSATQESVVLRNIQSLPSSVLHVIRSTFVHCKNSESVYSGRLHLVSDLLQALFREAYSLQKQLMELLDVVCVGPEADESDDILNMVFVIHSLLDICSVISSMDHAFHANTWKFIIKQSLKHQSVIKSQLRHTDIVTSLCEDLLCSFGSCLQLAEQMAQAGLQDNTDYRLFQKTLKLCRFLANSLLHYTKDFLPFLSDACCALHQLYLQIHRVPLLKALFCSFEQCSGELSLPVHLQGVKGGGRAAGAVPLYQHVCVHLCTFIASFHPSLFPELDVALLSAVLSANMITALLAMDAWCFLARYGTAELCAHHVTVVAHLVKSGPGESCQLTNLSLLLRRLCFLLAPPQQVDFIQTFPPEATENLPLWQHISFQAFPAELRKQAAREVTSVGATQSRGWLRSSRTAGELEALNTALSALLAVCDSAGEALEVGQQTAVMDAGIELWAFLNANLVTGQAYVQQTLSLLFPLLGFFIQTLDPQLITQVVTVQAALLRREPPDHVRLAALDFVRALGKTLLWPATQDRVLPSLCSVFAALLADRSWLLQQHALEAFTQFAEGTNHEDVIPQCLRSEDTKNRVVSFLEKTGFVDETAAARVERVKQEKGIFWGSSARVLSEEAQWPSSEPSSKRARHERPLEEEYRSAVRAARAALEAVGALLRTGPAPDWLPVEVLRLQEQVDELKRRGLQDEA
ncbi:FIGNL1-interacting regulator of recombination and mitosis isoform 7-T8 [Molossus nigricans]